MERARPGILRPLGSIVKVECLFVLMLNHDHPIQQRQIKKCHVMVVMFNLDRGIRFKVRHLF